MRVELNPKNPPERPYRRGGVLSEENRIIEAAVAQKGPNEWVAFHDFDDPRRARKTGSTMQQRRRVDRRSSKKLPPVATRVIGNTLWVLRLPEEEGK